MLGGPEGGAEEVGQDECQGASQKGVEEFKEGNSKDDCMVDEDSGFLRARHLELHPTLEQRYVV